MATNFYFNPFPTSQITPEQLLVEDLVIEAMQMYGMDIFYLPREGIKLLLVKFSPNGNKVIPKKILVVGFTS